MYEPDDYTTAGRLVLWWRCLTRHQCAASSIIQTLLRARGAQIENVTSRQTVSSAKYTCMNGGRHRNAPHTLTFVADVRTGARATLLDMINTQTKAYAENCVCWHHYI